LTTGWSLVATCRPLLCDDFGVMWWPKNKPMPDLMEIEEKNRSALRN
jgi:hypothetical protein